MGLCSVRTRVVVCPGNLELNRLREEEAKHPIEVVGTQVRQLFSRDNKK